MRYSFINDYSEGAHPKILSELARTNMMQTPGYGTDDFCARARKLILKAVGQPESQVHFFVGGTQTNLTVTAALLRPHQGVVSAISGHVNVHESGAIEATGHKVLTIPSPDGKLTAQAVQALIQGHYDDPTAEHTVQPGMVYISHPTELGTVYTKKELTDIHAVCKHFGLPLFVDGARLGSALASDKSDITLADLGEHTDLFYIGGTKMGALFGEALVINNPTLGTDFRYILKQRGGMLAKGRLLGIQFETLFTDALYLKLAQHANAMAGRLSDGIAKLGYDFAAEAATNQIFPILPKDVSARLQEDFSFMYIEQADDTHDVVRLCTSWATELNMVEAFLRKLAECTPAVQRETAD